MRKAIYCYRQIPGHTVTIPQNKIDVTTSIYKGSIEFSIDPINEGFPVRIPKEEAIKMAKAILEYYKEAKDE